MKQKSIIALSLSGIVFLLSLFYLASNFFAVKFAEQSSNRFVLIKTIATHTALFLAIIALIGALIFFSFFSKAKKVAPTHEE